jgi:hypothetical protein
LWIGVVARFSASVRAHRRLPYLLPRVPVSILNWRLTQRSLV